MSPTDATQARHWHDPDSGGGDAPAPGACTAARRTCWTRSSPPCPTLVATCIRRRHRGSSTTATCWRPPASPARRPGARPRGRADRAVRHAQPATSRGRRHPRPHRAVRRRPSGLPARSPRRPPGAAGSPGAARPAIAYPGHSTRSTTSRPGGGAPRRTTPSGCARTAPGRPAAADAYTASLCIYGDRLGPNSRRHRGGRSRSRTSSTSSVAARPSGTSAWWGRRVRREIRRSRSRFSHGHEHGRLHEKEVPAF